MEDRVFSLIQKESKESPIQKYKYKHWVLFGATASLVLSLQVDDAIPNKGKVQEESIVSQDNQNIDNQSSDIKDGHKGIHKDIHDEQDKSDSNKHTHTTGVEEKKYAFTSESVRGKVYLTDSEKSRELRLEAEGLETETEKSYHVWLLCKKSTNQSKKIKGDVIAVVTTDAEPSRSDSASLAYGATHEAIPVGELKPEPNKEFTIFSVSVPDFIPLVGVVITEHVPLKGENPSENQPKSKETNVNIETEHSDKTSDTGQQKKTHEKKNQDDYIESENTDDSKENISTNENSEQAKKD